VPASASLSIAAIADQLDGVALVVVLTAVVCAVAAGARSFVAAAEWVADLPAEVAAALGTDRRCPSESAIRRLIGRLDADQFDALFGGFVAGLCASAPPAGRRVLAVDGKTLRGSRRGSAAVLG
jgi:DDE_Tnp_1-associated